MKKFLLEICLCILSVGAAFAAMSANEFFRLCGNGTPQQVEVAIKAGADVNSQSIFRERHPLAEDEKSVFGETPLMAAARHNPNPRVITALIKLGVDIYAKDKQGKTAIDYSNEHKYREKDDTICAH